MSERFEWKTQRNMRRAGITAALAGIATGSVLLGPSPVAMEDIVYHASGRTTVVERAVDAMASKLYDTTVYARCAPTGRSGDRGIAGEASPIYHTLRLAPPVCAALGNVLINPSGVDSHDVNVIRAISTVSHEISHINGARLHKEYDEGVTQCLAAQRAQEVAEEFGIPADTANAMADSVATDVQENPPRSDYAIPAGCVAGGKYDIHALGGHIPYDAIASYINGG